MEIPDNYEVSSLPESIKITGLEGKLEFLYMVGEAQGNMINLSYKVLVNTNFFTEDEYYHVKSFFSSISDKLNESIALNRIQND